MHCLKAHFTRSVQRESAPLHFAAHSHHPWPDASLAGQQQAWSDAAELLDRKWEKVFGEVIPAAQRHIARVLGLADPATIVFAPNTHEFVRRLLSCLPERPRILTTDSEFHSFTRQTARLEEDGLAELVRIPTQPFETFAARLAEAAAASRFDLVFLSQVFFNSGWALAAAELDAIVGAVRDPETFIAIDGYHAFMALPDGFTRWQSRAFYIAGGYKYAMAGEGVCFMHCPPGYGPRPRDTGWYAEFGALSGARTDRVAYGTDGSRFAGSTFDPSGLYRFNAAQDWLAGLGAEGELTAHCAYAAGLQQRLIDALPATLRGSLLIQESARRGRFLTFATLDAERLEHHLGLAGILVDRRGDRLRVGFGIYQDGNDVDRLTAALTHPA